MRNSSGTLFEVIAGNTGPKHIAVIGSGGKTGTIQRLAKEARRAGKKAVINTTTKMWLPDLPVAQSAAEAAEMLKTESVVWAGSVLAKEGKLAALPLEEEKQLEGLADLILTEADGSRGLPLKYPGKNEPVIPKSADLILILLGLDCLGRPLREVCHRPETIPESLDVRQEEPVTPALAAKILKTGYLNPLPTVPFFILLNASERQPEESDISALAQRLPAGHCLIWLKDGRILTDSEIKTAEEPLMDKRSLRIGAVLMASGAGKRFGGDKLFAKVKGRTLIERTMENIPAETFEKILVVSKDERILELSKRYGFTPVANAAPEEGISSSVRLGTQGLAGLDAAMYFVCDQPYLTADTVRALVRRAEEEPGKIIVPEAEGRRGNPCIFPAAYFQELMALRADTGGKAVISQHPQAVRTLTVPMRELLDIDKKEDLPT